MANRSKTGHVALIPALITFFFYLLTLCPTIYLGDSGELVVAPSLLGIAHPLGFPLFTILGKLATFFPFGDMAYRINLLSAVFASLSTGLLTFLLVKIARINPFSAVFAALLLGGSTTLWTESIIARTYSLGVFFTAVFLGILWWPTPDRKETRTHLASFWLGLAIAHHLLLIVLAPMALFRVKELQLRKIGISICFFLLGLSLYLYLPLRASQSPLLNWGDPDHWVPFWDVMTQAQYRQKIFAPDWAPRIEMGKTILRSFTDEFVLQPDPLYGAGRIIIFLLILAGVLRLWRENRLMLLGIVATILSNIALKMSYYGVWELNQVLRYLLPAFFLIAFLIGIGLDQMLKKKWGKSGQVADLPLRLYVMVIFLLAPLWVGNFFKQDRSNHTLAHTRFTDVLKTLPFEAILLVGGDNSVFPAWYLQRVEKFREDVAVIPKSAAKSPWLIEDVRLNAKAPFWPDLLSDFKPGNPVFGYLEAILGQGNIPVFSLFDESYEPEDDVALHRLSERYRFDLYGLTFALAPAQAPSQNLLALNRSFFARYRLNQIENLAYDAHTSSVMYHYASMFNRLGLLIQASGDLKEAQSWFQRAIKTQPNFFPPWLNLANTALKQGDQAYGINTLKEAINRHPDAWEAHYNLGIVYFARNQRKQAWLEFSTVLNLDPDNEMAKEYIQKLETNWLRKKTEK